MKKTFNYLLFYVAYSLILINPVMAEKASNRSTESYKQQFVVNDIRYDLKVRHSEEGDLLIVSNNTNTSFLLFSDIEGKSQLIGPKEGQAIVCNKESIVGSSFILSTEARDFEETLSLVCGDTVVVRERGL